MKFDLIKYEEESKIEYRCPIYMNIKKTVKVRNT